MADCDICGVGTPPGNAPAHAACQAEFDRRVEAKKCVMCGRHRRPIGSYQCGRCTRDSPYVGYLTGGV